MSKILVLFYSTYGHAFAMARAAVQGVEAAGGTAALRRVPETLPAEVLEKMHAVQAQQTFAEVPLITTAELKDYDGIIIVTATRFGGLPSQLSTFIDTTGGHWFQGNLIGKVGSAICSTGSQHGGLEMAIGVIHTFFLHMGMVVVGLPNTVPGGIAGVEEVQGLTPYGAGTIAGSQGERQPSAAELDAARFQGKRVAEIARKLSA
jgi:NAD(P)H dehydrogenase (quinone)